MINPQAPVPLLEGRQITKYFGGLAAVNQVDLVIGTGEIVGLVGPNGSGKTTLLNCLSSIQRVDEGQIFFKSRDVTHQRPYQLARMGMARTFQSIRIYRQMTVWDNLLISCQWRGQNWLDLLKPPQPQTKKRAAELLEFLHLPELKDKYARQLSGGQQRLLEIGMALMPDPEIILLDEAASGINPTLLEKIADCIHILNQQQGKTFLLIEHNIKFISDLCDRVYVLHQGTKIAEGTPEEIKMNPAAINAYFGN